MDARVKPAHDSVSNSARALARAGLREMRVHDAPFAGFLAKDHGRAGDELLATVMDVLRRRRHAGPFAVGAAMAPDDRHLVGDNAADVERRPIARRHVLSVEFPQPKPMLAAVIGVAVQVEEHRLGRPAPDRLELLPIEAGIGVDVVGVQIEDPLAVMRGAADEIGLRHDLSDSNAGNLAYLSAQFARADVQPQTCACRIALPALSWSAHLRPPWRPRPD